MQIDLSYSEILETLITRIKYYSGKRASTAEEYFRHSACDADKNLLRDLLSESISRISFALGRDCQGATIATDTLSFYFKNGGEWNESQLQAITVLLRRAILDKAAWRWGCITGLECAGEWKENADMIIDLLQRRLRQTGRMPSRRPLCP